MEFSRLPAHLFFFHPCSGFSRVLEASNLASGPCLASGRFPYTSSLLLLCICGELSRPLSWALAVEQRWFSSLLTRTLFDQTLTRLLWTFFWARPWPWPAEPSLVRIPPPAHWISNQFPLSNFPSIDPSFYSLAIHPQLSVLWLEFSSLLY